jgi:zinc protease
MSERFLLPDVGSPATVQFPPISRAVLDNGMRIWIIPRPELPVVAMGMVINHGTAADPRDRPGLVSLSSSMLDEGAGGRDSIALADAVSRIGGHLDIEVGSDATTVALTSLSRCFATAVDLLGDVVMRPHFADEDLRRVRDLRQSRLRQLSQSASAAADRIFLSSVFGHHPYGHGQFGTIASLEQITVEQVRNYWERAFAPASATLVMVGDVDQRSGLDRARAVFGDWRATSVAASMPLPVVHPPDPNLEPSISIVSRPGASQSEVRIGHLGPPRTIARYHAIVVLNAILGGQFTSRINRNLRETRGITYGASSTFDMRRRGGSFACASGVQSSATAVAVSEVLRELTEIRGITPVQPDEISRAKASLTRGYARQFETTAQLGRGAVVLATYGLADDTFDRFVPSIEAVTADDVSAAAAEYLHPDQASVVVVGDEELCRPELERLGRPVRTVTPEF